MARRNARKRAASKRKAPTAEQRRRTGIKSGPNKGKYPLDTLKQALSAIKLRHHGKGVSPSSTLNRVARSKWGNNPTVKRRLKEARERDRKRKK
jgi:hypothetical protein